jgi:hypothetical protein
MNVILLCIFSISDDALKFHLLKLLYQICDLHIPEKTSIQYTRLQLSYHSLATVTSPRSLQSTQLVLRCQDLDLASMLKSVECVIHKFLRVQVSQLLQKYLIKSRH